MTALMFGAAYSTPEMVQLLLDEGANKSYIDNSGKTAYDYAVEKGNNDNARLLADWKSSKQSTLMNHYAISGNC